MRVVLPLVLVSCATAPAARTDFDGDDGWSSRPVAATAPVPTGSRAQPLPPDARPPFPAAKLADLQPASPRRRSEHLGGDLDHVVWVNAAADAYRALVPTTTFPPGAILASRHLRPQDDVVVATYVMEKTTAGWTFEILDPQARRVSSRPLDACARCHAEAPYDGVFGPGVDARGTQTLPRSPTPMTGLP